MKKVTLYQVSKTDQVVSGDHLELRQYSYDQITPIRNSDEFIIQKGKCVEVTNLPIQKYVICQNNWKTGEVIENIVYAAFDSELLKLIQCERNKFDELINENEVLRKDKELLITTTKKIEGNLRTLDEAYQEYLTIGFWKRLVYLFKGKI